MFFGIYLVVSTTHLGKDVLTTYAEMSIEHADFHFGLFLFRRFDVIKSLWMFFFDVIDILI